MGCENPLTIQPIAAAMEMSPVETPHSSSQLLTNTPNPFSSSHYEEHAEEHGADNVPSVEPSSSSHSDPSEASEAVGIEQRHYRGDRTAGQWDDASLTANPLCFARRYEELCRSPFL